MPPLKLFWSALGFYTRLPVLKNSNYTLLPEAAVYLPVIGWLVGALSASVFYTAQLLWPQPIAAVLTLIAGIFITGAFHEDGLADVCDGFGGGWNKEQILAIMKDSRIGAYGAIALSLQFILKTVLLSLLPAVMAPACLLAGHSLSRFAPLLMMYRYNYARSTHSKSGSAVFRPNCRQLMFAAVLALLPCVFLNMSRWWALAPVFLVNAGLARYFNSKIGGYTGDCLGAGQQVAETVFYLCVSVSWTFI